MPRFAPFLNKIHEKLEEAKISDLNHELGKIAQGSAAYFGNLRADASSLFRASSSKLWSHGKSSSAGLPKSVSLPTGFQIPKRISNNNTFREDTPQSKYKYRSSVILEDDEDVFGPSSKLAVGGDSSSVVDRFIRVIEAQEQIEREAEPRLKSREEIRKTLAAGAFGTSENQRGGVSKKTGDLEVCFINESAIEEEPVKEEDAFEGLHEAAAIPDPEQQATEPGRFPRSKSDWEAFRNPDLTDYQEDSSKSSRENLRDLQARAASALSNCQQLAARKISSEKKWRQLEEDNSLKKLIGRDISRPLTVEKLSVLNSAALQVIVNHNLSCIEKLNEELVTLLLEKDELQIEQDSQLVDIDDLSQPTTSGRKF